MRLGAGGKPNLNLSDQPPTNASEPPSTPPEDELVPDASVARPDYQGPSPGSDDFKPKEHRWDGTQWWTRDRQFWWTGKRWRSVTDTEPDPLEADQSHTPLKPKGEHGPGLWIGFFGAIAGNVLLLILLAAARDALFNLVGDAAFTIQGLAPWVLNIGALIAFAAWPRGHRIALGMLLAYGVALALGVVGAILLAVICFGGSRGVP